MYCAFDSAYGAYLVPGKGSPIDEFAGRLGVDASRLEGLITPLHR
jgi:hypothetical protein